MCDILQLLTCMHLICLCIKCIKIIICVSYSISYSCIVIIVVYCCQIDIHAVDIQILTFVFKSIFYDCIFVDCQYLFIVFVAFVVIQVLSNYIKAEKIKTNNLVMDLITAITDYHFTNYDGYDLIFNVISVAVVVIIIKVWMKYIKRYCIMNKKYLINLQSYFYLCVII